jgi:hypothetical protein
MLESFVSTSALASSISSRMSTLIRSETSVTAVAKFSGRELSAAKALEDHREQESTGERRPHGQLGTFVDACGDRRR